MSLGIPTACTDTEHLVPVLGFSKLKIHVVGEDCPDRSILETCAVEFQRDQQEKDLKYTVPTTSHNAKRVSILIVDGDKVIGAESLFENLHFPDCPIRYCFEWIVVHTANRGKGLYKGVHQQLKTLYPFYPQTPFSPEMQAFPEKYDSELLGLEQRLQNGGNQRLKETGRLLGYRR